MPSTLSDAETFAANTKISQSRRHQRVVAGNSEQPPPPQI